MWHSSLSSLDDFALLWLSGMAEIGFAGSLIVLALTVLSARGHSGLAICWGAGILMALTSAALLKGVMVDNSHTPHFPSGHVVLAVVFYGGLILVLLPRGAALATAFLVLGTIALLEGVSRIVLTEHGWLDVIGGFVVGAAALFLTGTPWPWSRITGRDRVWLTGALIAWSPLAWLACSDVDPLIRGLARM